MKKIAIRTLVAVSTATLALVAASPASAAEVDVPTQRYVDVPPAGPIFGNLTSSHDAQVDDHGIAWVSGSGGTRG